MNNTFEFYLKKFPKVDLPISLTNESHFAFSRENDVLSKGLLEEWILPMEEEEDAYTEYVPCFQLPEQEGFVAIVYWKAALLNYEYVLATYTKKGQLITRQTIAGMKTNKDTLLQRLAFIDEELIITVAEGTQEFAEQASYNPEATNSYHMEILPSGDIIYALG
jgi:hypothetical protein